MIFSLPALLLLLEPLCGSWALASLPTYEHLDPVTGAVLICDMCPPGTHLVAHCSAVSRTKCSPCKAEHFTELWNYLPYCLYCNNFCKNTQEVERECAPISNRVCRCKRGYYDHHDYCSRHSVCGPGQGVKTRGTSHNDTECETCTEGFFSSSSSAVEPCVKHHDCASGGEMTYMAGSASHDTLCGSCQDFISGGEALRTFYARFFAQHRMAAVKLRRFNTRIMLEEGETEGRRRVRVPHRRSLLLTQIKLWLPKAPVERLRALPQMLRESQLNSLSDKLHKRLSEIEAQATSCTQTP